MFSDSQNSLFCKCGNTVENEIISLSMTNVAFDYRPILRDELVRRIQANPRYSLRAFARDLDLSPARLSEVLSGKQGLSASRAEKIAELLGYIGEERHKFILRAKACDSRSKNERINAQKELGQFGDNIELKTRTQISLDHFALISEWYHLSILQMTTLKNFDSDPVWIARKLGISLHESRSAIERLIRLGYLQYKGERLVRSQSTLATPNDIPSDAIKSYQKAILEKAMEALYTQSLEERDISSLVIGIDTSKLPVLKEAIRNFRKSLDALAESNSRSRNEVYVLSTQFFKITKSVEGL